MIVFNWFFGVMQGTHSFESLLFFLAQIDWQINIFKITTPFRREQIKNGRKNPPFNFLLNQKPVQLT